MRLKLYMIVFAAGLIFFSCKKDYQCQCTNENNTYDAGDPVTARSKNKANKLCDELSSGPTKCSAK